MEYRRRLMGKGKKEDGFFVTDFEYTGSVQTLTLSPGRYKLECWGAQGGSTGQGSIMLGGRGGYSTGELSLSVVTVLYIYVGGQGIGRTKSSQTLLTGGFNGGGNGYSTDYGVGSGGGASDIRIGRDSLYCRVIVAGGGGGCGARGKYVTSKKAGGRGGGTTGGSAPSSGVSYNGGTGGSQTAAGISYDGATANPTNYNASLASFGVGGGWSSGTNRTAGGGGGWYGGGFSSSSGAGGGSGYVYDSSTASNYPSGCLLGSSYYLSNASTTNTNVPTTDGSGSESGHDGNGFVRITKIS